MQPRRLLTLSVLLSSLPFALAQEPSAPAPSKEQKLLDVWIGTWDVTATNLEGPAPMVMQAIEETTSICGGMWLLSKVTGTNLDFQGIAITGWDATKSKYVGVWVDSMTAAASTSQGTRDAKTGSFAFDGSMSSPEGARTTFTTTEFPTADTRLETVHAVDKDGKKTKVMEIRATRKKDQKTAPASATKSEKLDLGLPDPKDPMHKHLAPFAGNWKIGMTMTAPGMPEMPPNEMKSSDTLNCNDLWLVTHATGSFSGMAFEGYGLTGYDPAKKQYVSYWVDAFGPFLMESTGTCSADGKTFTMRGDGIDMTGKPVTTVDTCKMDGKDHYVRTMVSTAKDGKDAGTMTLDCTRTK
ncbi:MAG: DUF1579 family protein [Planctomycetota bacterium]